jgi:DTW domain-containing protein YfiP
VAKKSRALLLGFVAVIVVAPLLLYPFVHDKLEEIRVHVPEYQRPPQLVRLDQNWTPAERKRFHHTPQGTRLVPYAWFKALEQPCLSPFGC